MALILNIETSTNVCSTSLSNNGIVEAYRESMGEKTHARKLTIFIDEIMKEQNISFDDLDAVAVSKGPGSYTGLRIGVSAAKGICYAKDLPLIAVNTLQSMAYGIKLKIEAKKLSIEVKENAVFIPMIDARRMEVYSAFFNQEAAFERDVRAEIIDENSYKDILNDRQVFMFGNGADKIQNVLKHPNAHYIHDINPSSIDMAFLSEKAFRENDFVDAAYFEPFYLKDFIATVPKKNIFK